MGPNGSGKTTLFNLIPGALGPDAGRIRLAGRDITGWSPHRVCAEGITRTFQHVRPFAGLSTLENVLVGRLYGRARERRATAAAEAERLLALVGLGGRGHVPAASLTLMDRKRLELARALATAPHLLLLDELMAGLSPVEIVALLGPNGAGKTTLIRCVTGLLVPRAGRIRFGGAGLVGLLPHAIVGRGLAVVPEGRRLFGGMTVEENLDLGAFTPHARAGLGRGRERIYEIFPILRERRRQLAGTLSGGQQQMVAIGRALMAAPRLLILDEPSLGLAPRIVETILGVIGEINH